MPFPRELLRPQEELVLDTKPHWWFMVPASAALAAALLLGVIVLAAGPGDGFLGSATNIVTGILVLAALAFFANRYAAWVSTNFVVTSDRVVFREGIVSKRGIEIPVDKINTVFFEQTVFERMLGLGDIKIESASTQGASVFEDIPKPSPVQNIIYSVIDAKSDASFDRVGQATADAVSQLNLSAAAGASQISIAEQLEKLHLLLQQGAITQDEYESQKAHLLGQ